MAEGKRGCLSSIGSLIFFIIVGSLIYQCFSGESEGMFGVYNPRYDGTTAIIKISDYDFDEDNDVHWWEVCDQIIEAANHENTNKIMMELVTTYKDEYGETYTKTYSGRFDDPSVRPISEMKKYQSGADLFRSKGMGLVAVYVIAKM